MFSGSNGTLNPRSYVWSYPGCAVRIHLSFDVIDQLDEEVAGASGREQEIGGLLIGRKQTGSGPVKIVDFVPLNPEGDHSGSYFIVPSAKLAEVKKRCPSDSQVVGYYRTAIDHQFRLRTEDLNTIQTSFVDHSSVFLVITVKDGRRATAGFFPWQGNAVSPDPLLTFPFSTAELESGGWPTEDEGGNNWMAGLFSKIARFSEQTSIRAKIAILVGLIGLLTTVILTRSNSPAAISAVAVPTKLGLRVERDGPNFRIAWDPAVRDLAGARAGNLLVSDGGGPPTFVSLTPEQIRHGSLTYASTALGDKVEFRLDVLGGSGATRTESIISISASPTERSSANVAARSAQPTLARSPSPTEQQPQTNLRDVSHRTPESRPAQSLVPREGSQVSSVRMVGPLVAKLRAFVPPRPQAAPVESPMPDPPTILPDGESLSEYQMLNSWGGGPARPAAPPRREQVQTLPGMESSGVTITSEPSGAKVEINGILAGYTPVTVKVTPLGLGFTVTVVKEGFAKWMTQTFSTAQPYGLHAQLRELPKEPAQ